MVELQCPKCNHEWNFHGKPRGNRHRVRCSSIQCRRWFCIPEEKWQEWRQKEGLVNRQSGKYKDDIVQQVKEFYPNQALPKFYNKNLKPRLAIHLHVDVGDKEFSTSFDNAMKELDMVPIPV